MLAAFVVDPCPVARTGVRELLSTRKIEVVGEARTAHCAWEALRCADIQFAFLELDLPTDECFVLLQRLARHRSDVNVVIVTMVTSLPLFRRAFEVGVAGYLLKDTLDVELALAMHMLCNNRPFVSSGMASLWVTEELSGRAQEPRREWERLSACEREFLTVLGRYWHEPNRRVLVAESLNISVHSYDSKLKSLRRKLGLSSVAELRPMLEALGLIGLIGTLPAEKFAKINSITI
jgi:two-component system, NarL family, nitrate/nitrite response regulator NarL